MPVVSAFAAFRRFRFARFELQLDERRLLADGRPVAIGGHALDVLATLLSRPGQLIGKTELLRAVWGKVVVEENTLQAQVSALRKVLGAEAITTVPGRGYRFALPVEAVPLTVAPPPCHNLPLALTSFIGREREMQQIRQHLTGTRLLTLTGAGGCGKTRIAVEVAGTVVDAYADGTWVVELAALADPTLLAPTLARALKIEARSAQDLGETIVERLRPKRLLLLLDNAEHLLEACAAWAERLLRHCAGLTLLVTSRERLGIDGETTWRVPSLSLPGQQPGDDPLASEATRLFIDRARLHRHDFDVADDEVSTLGAVCRRLDGIALAIELAAAQVRVMSLDTLYRGLDDRFRLLTGGSRTALPRHRTLGALIAWSHELLTGPEQTLLRRAAVFAGGWTRSAAERVCGGEGLDTIDIWRLLTTLADKHLIVADVGGDEVRFGMLETVRHFALERLIDSGERPSLGDRLLAHVAHLAGELRPGGSDDDVQRTVKQLLIENDNLRAALAWCEADPARARKGLQLAGALHWYWLLTNQFREGRAWLERLLAAAGDEAADETHAIALQTLGRIVIDDGEGDAAVALLRRAAALWRLLGNRHELARTLGMLGHAAGGIDDVADVRAHFEEALAIGRELDEPRVVACASVSLASLAREANDFAGARRLLEEAASVSRRVGPWMEGQVGSQLGQVLTTSGELQLAHDTLADAAIKHKAFGDAVGEAYTLLWLTIVSQDLRDPKTARAHLQGPLLYFSSDVRSINVAIGCLDVCAGLLPDLGEPLAAARLWGCAEHHGSQVTYSAAAWNRLRSRRLQQAARQAVGDDSAFDRAWQEGRDWSLDEALGYARSLLMATPPVGHAEKEQGPPAWPGGR